MYDSPDYSRTGGFRPWPVMIIGVLVVIVVFVAIYLINRPSDEPSSRRDNDAATYGEELFAKSNEEAFAT